MVEVLKNISVSNYLLKNQGQKKAKQEIFLLSGCQLINNLKFLKACKNIKISSEFQALFIIIINKNSGL